MTARKPTELKRALGNPGKRSLPTPAILIDPVERDLEPPSSLSNDGAREWKRILSTCPWIGPSDIQNLRLYCEAIERRSHLLATLAEQGWVLYTDRGYAYLNPAAGALSTTETQLTKWMSLLGLTPSDRGRLGVAEVKAQSALERIRASRAKAV